MRGLERELISLKLINGGGVLIRSGVGKNRKINKRGALIWHLRAFTPILRSFVFGKTLLKSK